MLSLNTLKAHCLEAGITTDFDGTISTITLKQADARIDKEAKHLLESLSRKYRLVGVLSGRPVKQVSNLVGIKNIFYSGNHGAEFFKNGKYFINSQSLKQYPLIKEVYNKLKAHENKYDLDFKKYSLSVHFRNSLNPNKTRHQLLQSLNQLVSPGMTLKKGRMVFDICAKNINKGTVIKYIVEKHHLKYLLYIGDDQTDIDAFIRMKKLEQKRGIKTLKIAIVSPEAPKNLGKHADYTLNSLKEINELFRNLLR